MNRRKFMPFRNIFITVTVFGFLLALSACTGSVKPLYPEIDQKAAPIQRQATYDLCRLRMSGDAFWGVYFIQGTNTAQFQIIQVASLITGMSPEAKKAFDSANANLILSDIFGIAGGAVVGYTLGYAITGRDIPGAGYIVLAGGIGSLIACYLFANAATGDLRNSVDEYNKALKGKLDLAYERTRFLFTPSPYITYDPERKQILVGANLLTILF
jgi:hypothetical protein